MTNVVQFAITTVTHSLVGGLFAGCGSYLLAGRKFFNLQFIEPNTSFKKGFLIGSSMIATGSLVSLIVSQFLDTQNKDQKNKNTSKDNEGYSNYLKLLKFVPLIAIPGYIYGKSSPLTAISLPVLAVLVPKCIKFVEGVINGPRM